MKTYVGGLSSLFSIVALFLCYGLTLQARNLASMTNKKLDAPSTQSMIATKTKQNNETEDFYLSCACNALKENKKDDAISYFVKALELSNANTDTLFNLGNLYFEKDVLKSAVMYYLKFLELNNNAPLVHYNLGMCYKKMNDNDKALEQFQVAMRMKPDHSKAYLECGLLLNKKGDKEGAMALLEKAASCDCKDPVIMHELGCMYRENNQCDKALDLFKKALELDPYCMVYKLELANLLAMMDQFEPALKLYFELLETSPKLKSVFYNIGYILKRQGHVAEALDVFKKILEFDSDDALARFSLGLAYLTLGDFEQGFSLYEWRAKAYNEESLCVGKGPVWDGSSLQGKVLLLVCEQGYGDTFQFIRYAKVAKSMGARVIVCAQQPLKTFLQNCCPYIDEVVVAGDAMPSYDYQLPLMSMPFMLKTTLKTVPAEIPYLVADPTLVRDWASRLNKDFKIGVCWQGNSSYHNQVLRSVVKAKSVELKKFMPLTSIKGCSFYSLQKINGMKQLEAMGALCKVIDFGDQVDEEHGRFMDTAAIIANLDLVITVDTAIGHLAAALGKPVWILLPMPADWRWMLDRADTPWYPSVRLFRQQEMGNWDDVMSLVARELERVVGNRYESEDLQEPYQEVGDAGDQTMPNITNLAEFLDELTIQSIKIDTSIDIAELKAIMASRSKSQDLYYSTLKSHPEIKNYTLCLFACNRLLYDLEKKMLSPKVSIFSTALLNISDQMCSINLFKTVIKNHINNLSSSKE